MALAVWRTTGANGGRSAAIVWRVEVPEVAAREVDEEVARAGVEDGVPGGAEGADEEDGAT